MDSTNTTGTRTAKASVDSYHAIVDLRKLNQITSTLWVRKRFLDATWRTAIKTPKLPPGMCCKSCSILWKLKIQKCSKF